MIWEGRAGSRGHESTCQLPQKADRVGSWTVNVKYSILS